MKKQSLVLASLLVAGSTFASAQPPNNKMYGGNAEFSSEQLPLGQLRSRLESLPPNAKAKAEHWLRGFSFPEQDLELIRIDDNGAVLYADTDTPAAVEAPSTETTTPAGLTAADTFSLHSKPGAPNTVFIDFDGHVISGTAWNNGSLAAFYARPFSTDADENNFSDNELNQIAQIWYRISEDLAAFDIDVTTEAPSSFGPNVGHVLITPSTDANNNPMPHNNAGGVAYVNVFGSSNYSYYSPALVYSNNLGNYPPYIVEAASHEFGHNAGLSHDGTSTQPYYGGHGSNLISWGPIMGTGYGRNVTQWNNGDYADANNSQDDLQIITAKLGLVTDDHGNNFSSATLLVSDNQGVIHVTTPQQDAYNEQTANKGVLGINDIDVFTFNTGSGDITLNITPAWAAWDIQGSRGANLDVEARLYDANGNQISISEPTDNTNASINASVSEGDYYLSITGVGNAISPYSAYGSQGQYFISGQLQPVVPDTEAPTPNPMQFAVAPNASGSDRISMTATVASDNKSNVLYQFRCVTANNGCQNSGWQSSTQYTATGLNANTQYGFVVAARDSSGNETSESAAAYATTPTAPQPPVAPNDFNAADGTDGTAQLSWTDNNPGSETYNVWRESWHSKRNRWQAAVLIATLNEGSTGFTDASGAGLFRYRLDVINAQGTTSSSLQTVTVTDSSSGGGKGGKGGGDSGGDGSCKGGPKKCG